MGGVLHSIKTKNKNIRSKDAGPSEQCSCPLGPRLCCPHPPPPPPPLLHPLASHSPLKALSPCRVLTADSAMLTASPWLLWAHRDMGVQHTCTHRHTCMHAHRHEQICTHIDTDTRALDIGTQRMHMCTHACMHTDTWPDMDTHRHMDTGTHRHMHIHGCGHRRIYCEHGHTNTCTCARV